MGIGRRRNRHVEIIDEMIESLRELQAALPELERRNRFQAAGDGFSGSSGGVSGGGGGISNPTERAALQRAPADPVRQWTNEALTQLSNAREAIMVADNRRRLVFSVVGADLEPEACQNPACGDVTAAPLRDGRCPACYQFRRRNGAERSPRRKVSA